MLGCRLYSVHSFLFLQAPSVPYRTKRYHTATTQTPNFPCIHHLFILTLLIRKPLPRPIATVSRGLQFTRSLVSVFVQLLISSPTICMRHCHSTEVRENLRAEFAQLMSHHILRDRDIVVHLSIMHLELQPHEVRQDRRRALLRPDGDDLLSLSIAHDWKPGLLVLVCVGDAWDRSL